MQKKKKPSKKIKEKVSKLFRKKKIKKENFPTYTEWGEQYYPF